MKKILIAAAALAATATTMVAVPAVAAPQAQTIKVTEREYRIALSAKPKAGTVTFVVKNAGDDAHDFWVKGGGKTARSKVVGGGASAGLTIKLKRGVRYQYWCAIDDHAVEGMRGSFVAR